MWVKLLLETGGKKPTLKSTFPTGSAFLFIGFPVLFISRQIYLLIFSLTHFVVNSMFFSFYLFIPLFSQFSSFI